MLVDVPCSNTGVLGKRPEALASAARRLRHLVALQGRLLRLAIRDVSVPVG